MGALEEGGKVAIQTVESLGKNPLVLGLILVNVLFMVGGGWIVHDVSDRVQTATERRDKMLGDLIRACRSFEEKNGK